MSPRTRAPPIPRAPHRPLRQAVLRPIAKRECALRPKCVPILTVGASPHDYLIGWRRAAISAGRKKLPCGEIRRWVVGAAAGAVVEEVVAPIHVRVTEETDASLEPVAVIQREIDPAIEAWNKEAQRREVDKHKPLTNTAKVGGETFDLPPRRKAVVEVVDYQEPQVICKCDPNDPNQICPACMDSKY